MSSDESEGEDVGDDPEYHILSPLWRHHRVAGWLRMFDALHNILRKSGDVSVSRGSFPRRRKVTRRKSSSTKFVAGLPENAYDPEWRANSMLRKYDLLPSQDYDFSHDSDIIEWVNLILLHYFSLKDVYRLALQHAAAHA